MSEAAHTPGPWHLEGNWEDNGRKLGGWVSTMHPSPVFELEPLVGEAAEIIANGHLIAAAPEMLDALKSMAEYLAPIADQELFPEEFHRLQVALAIIAKAEGRA